MRKAREMYTFLVINIVILVLLIILSFGKSIRFIKQWRFLLPALLLTSAVFTCWDYFFTLWNVWGFNTSHTIGFTRLNLPVEEFIFSLTIPFACVFVYEMLNFYVKKDYLKYVSKPLGWVLIFTMTYLVLKYPEKLYTSISALTTCALLTWNQLYFNKPWLGRFWLAYLLWLFPFLIIKGILNSIPVMVYNGEFNLGISLFSVPLEDFIYQFDLMMLVVTIYEKQRPYFSTLPEKGK